MLLISVTLQKLTREYPAIAKNEEHTQSITILTGAYCNKFVMQKIFILAFSNYTFFPSRALWAFVWFV